MSHSLTSLHLLCISSIDVFYVYVPLPLDFLIQPKRKPLFFFFFLQIFYMVGYERLFFTSIYIYHIFFLLLTISHMNSCEN